MAKHTQTIRRQKPTNCLSVSDHFVGLALKGLNVNFAKKHFAYSPQLFGSSINLKKKSLHLHSQSLLSFFAALPH